jgi:hypothetical protein
VTTDIGDGLYSQRPERATLLPSRALALQTGHAPHEGSIAAMKLLSGNSNPLLVQSIASYLEMPITQASVRRFADEEIFVEVLENVRGLLPGQ